MNCTSIVGTVIGTLAMQRSDNVSNRVKANLHYAVSELEDRPNSSSLQVCDQPRTCLRSG